MKNLTKIIGTLAVALTLTSACKKEKTEVVENKDQKFAVSIQVSNRECKPEKGILIGTKAELKNALSGKQERLFLKKVGKKNNVFIPVVGDTGSVGPVMDMCWEEINSYYTQNVQQWQSIANENCTPFLTCITCPNANSGLWVSFAIQPTSARCNFLENVEDRYQYIQFDFSEDEYDSAAASAYIDKATPLLYKAC